MSLDRRSFLKLLGAGAGLAGLPMIGCASSATMPKGSARRVVVIGGGYGGTIAAKYVRMLDPSIEVVLIEKNKEFVSCPFSNLYIGGLLPDLSSITIGYDKLTANHGIKLVRDEVTSIDAAAKMVVTKNEKIAYDRLIVSPGVGFITDDIKGYDENTGNVMPHAWKAGPQTVLLRQQLEAMPNGGTVLMSIPGGKYRCPPGPYERISMMAMFLKKYKPKSKIIALDANADIASKGKLFRAGWEKHYGFGTDKSLIDYRPAKRVTEINAAKKMLVIDGLEEFNGDVINLIPHQRAAKIAVSAGLIGEDKKWCPVDPTTFESTIHKGIHVIGDACDAGAMPKSGHSANAEAKVCAQNVVALMNGRETVQMSGINTCYSYITEDEAVSVAAVYTLDGGKIVGVKGAGGVSPGLNKAEAIYAKSWVKNILTEMST